MEQKLNVFSFLSKNLLLYSIILLIENNYNPLNWWILSGFFQIVMTIIFELYILGTSLEEKNIENGNKEN
jgi:hypothetical protein